jgi:hypothetical protein
MDFIGPDASSILNPSGQHFLPGNLLFRSKEDSWAIEETTAATLTRDGKKKSQSSKVSYEKRRRTENYKSTSHAAN